MVCWDIPIYLPSLFYSLRHAGGDSDTPRLIFFESYILFVCVCVDDSLYLCEVRSSDDGRGGGR